MLIPTSFNLSIEIALGAGPEEFRPYNFFSLAFHTIANRSPPIPHPVGSTNPSTAFAAIAASIALPPFFRMLIAVCVASG